MSSYKTSSLPQKPPNHSSINSTPTNAMSLEITQKWFALYVKARHEKVVDRALHRVGFDSFLPLYFSIIILMFLVIPAVRPSLADSLFKRSSPWWAYPFAKHLGSSST